MSENLPLCSNEWSENLMLAPVFLRVITDGDGIPSSRWSSCSSGVARAEPPGDEGREQIPLDPRVSRAVLQMASYCILYNTVCMWTSVLILIPFT